MSSLTTPAAQRWESLPSEEERLVAHLAEVTRVRFSGEGDEHLVIHASPSKTLQLGILPSLPAPNPGDPSTPQQLARRFGQAPSTMGLDFRVALEDEQAQLNVSARFAFYIQRYPDRGEQEGFINDASQMTREDVEDADDDDGQAPPATPPTVGAGAGSAPPTMKLMPKYERFDIAIDTPVSVSGQRGSVTVDLTPEVARQLSGALRDPHTVYSFLARQGQTLPESTLSGDQKQWEAAIAAAEGNARATPHPPPTVTLDVSWQPDGDAVRISLSFSNETLQQQRGTVRGRSRAQQGGPRVLPRELALFNVRLAAAVSGGQLRQMAFHQAPADFRYLDTRNTWALGRACVGRHDGNAIVSDTWPVYRQPRSETPRGENDSLVLTFEELADDARMMGALSRVLGAMRAYDGRWARYLQDEFTGDEATRDECERARERWRSEIEAFERGITCLAADEQLARSFRAANTIMRRVGASRGIEAWRLFQVVFIVIQLTALRARRVDDPDLRADLDICDVLWFATGGGKTEAYLGLIICAMFYDRYRGKQRGTTALLRYPLRMLSVQQLQRVLVALVAAEDLRQEMLAAGESVDGQPFELGYWAGYSNTPNLLSDQYNDGETTIEWWDRQLKAAPDITQGKRIVTNCPRLDCDGQLVLHADVTHVRLRYICGSCDREAPVHMTDEEVYRAAPSMVVCTVDKLARVARAAELVNLFAGPAYECPDHGYFTWHRTGRDVNSRTAPTVTDRCAVGDRCKRPATNYRTVGATLDPCPALIVEDELHLLEEELGTFDSHYESLTDVLLKELGDGLPPKILAATATIEGGEAQVANLYARHIREFPSQGWERWNSFYVATDHNAARRLYVGALPNRPDVMEFGAKAQAYIAEEVWRLQADPEAALTELGYAGRDSAWMSELLERYELTLGYINRKENATRISTVLSALHHQGALPFEYQHKVLVAGAAGESSLADIAAVLDTIEIQYTDGTDPEDRLRGLIATSLISHGVDLDRLNVEVMNRMTPDVAGYVQATSRSGRRYTGLVLVGFDRRNVRESSFFQHFLDYHAYIDRLIAPVPVNRFARFAVRATMPGIVSSLMLHVFSRRQLDSKGLNPSRPMQPLFSRFWLRPWWTGPDGPADKSAALRALAMQALAIGQKRRRRLPGGGVSEPERLFPPVIEQWLEQTAEHEFDRQLALLANFQSRESLANKLSPKPLNSFRSVDDPMEFRCQASATDIQADLTDPTNAAPARRRRGSNATNGNPKGN